MNIDEKKHNIPKEIRQVDLKLRNRVKEFELLPYVNPTNTEIERKKFIKSGFKTNPIFKYKPLDLNPLEFKRSLLSIKTENINDSEIRQMYDDTIQSYVDKVDMLSNLGNRKFLYNSLKYFGQPSSLDLKQARFLLMCPNFMDENDEMIFTADDAAEDFRKASDAYGFDLKIEVKSTIVARALALNSKQKVYLKKGIMFSKRDIDGLIEHEIGVHILTSRNGKLQPLRLFSLGTPLNTKTQEGLAVVSEYLSNNMNLNRLRDLALRVIIVDKMVDGSDFKSTFEMLKDEFKLPTDKAFFMTTRVYRGGGFTKDYLYIRGLRIILKKLNSGTDFSNLFIGKTSIEYLDTINKMVEMEYLVKPELMTKAFLNHKVEPQQHKILKYLLEGLVD